MWSHGNYWRGWFVTHSVHDTHTRDYREMQYLVSQWMGNCRRGWFVTHSVRDTHICDLQGDAVFGVTVDGQLSEGLVRVSYGTPGVSVDSGQEEEGFTLFRDWVWGEGMLQ